MKVVILAGGLGTRLSEETHLKPKPMVEINGKPILWHIMKIYNHYGFSEFIICCGFKGYVIKEYFSNYFLHMSDVSIDMKDNSVKILQKKAENWKVTLVDTGESSNTGGRLRRIKKYIGNDTFCFTYGDGVADIDLNSLIKSHKLSKKLATVTAVQPKGRFGSLSIDDNNTVNNFQEKIIGNNNWINAGFFVLEPSVIDLIKDDFTVWEKEPLETLAKQNQLNAFKHNGFWQPMDTLREKILLDDLLKKNKAPWKLW